MNFQLKPEDALQRLCVEWFRWQFPKRLIWATPNGGFRNKVTAMILKMTGVTPGVPDLFIPEPYCGAHGLFVELKIKPNKLSPHQIALRAELITRGYTFALCYSLEEFQTSVRNYFVM